MFNADIRHLHAWFWATPLREDKFSKIACPRSLDLVVTNLTKLLNYKHKKVLFCKKHMDSTAYHLIGNFLCEAEREKEKEIHALYFIITIRSVLLSADHRKENLRVFLKHRYCDFQGTFDAEELRQRLQNKWVTNAYFRIDRKDAPNRPCINLISCNINL